MLRLAFERGIERADLLSEEGTVAGAAREDWSLPSRLAIVFQSVTVRGLFSACGARLMMPAQHVGSVYFCCLSCVVVCSLPPESMLVFERRLGTDSTEAANIGLWVFTEVRIECFGGEKVHSAHWALIGAELRQG